MLRIFQDERLGFTRAFYLRCHGSAKFFPVWAPAHSCNLTRGNRRAVACGMRRRARSRVMRLNAVEATPASRTVTLALGKNPGKVALVDKAAGLGNIREL